jgi:hypothetical protein
MLLYPPFSAALRPFARRRSSSDLLGAVVAIAYVWFLVAAIMDCFTSRRSDLSKINWITFILVVPFVGLLVFFIFGGTRAKKKGMDSPVSIEGDAASPRR